MPKLAPGKQHERRERILDCAERCFTQRGFRATTMDGICAEAGLSTGALYGYFSSKEDLIAGLCERESDRFGKQLSQVGEAEDFFGALQSMAERFCCEEPVGKVRLHVEIVAEASRNEIVRNTMRRMDRVFQNSFAQLLEREKDLGRIDPKLPIETIVAAISALGKGIFSRRALHQDLDPSPIVPAIMAMVLALLMPVPPASQMRD
jgi:TetR/AcrR family transcriptional regulator, repressor for uid operon